MRLCHQIAGLVLLPAALFLGYHAWRLPYYSSLGPGPGFFPLWLCGLLALLSLVMIVQAARRSPSALPADFFGDYTGYLRILAAIVALFATVSIMPLLGFRATTFLFYIVMLVVFGRRNPIEIVALAALGSFGVHYLFSQMLKQPLPAGSLGW